MNNPLWRYDFVFLLVSSADLLFVFLENRVKCICACCVSVRVKSGPMVRIRNMKFPLSN